MPRVSQFWLDRLAGKPLGPAWARKDVQIALHEPAWCDELPLNLWMRIDTHEQQRLLRVTVLAERDHAA